jgi:hypothetical protein
MADVPERTEPADPRQLRASDADRERVAEVLRRAAGEGRLGLDELEERLGSVYAARTYAELEPLTHDLPAAGGPPPMTSPAPSRAPKAVDGAIAIMGGFERKGRWQAPKLFRGIVFWGGGDIDLRDAVLVDGEIKVQVVALMGGVSVTVPENAEVHVGGAGIMGAFANSASGPGAPGGPRITVTGVAFWAGVDVVRKPPEEEVRRRKLERKRQRAERRKIEG